MSIKTVYRVLVLLVMIHFQVDAQIVGDLNTLSVNELDAIQLQSGTWIATSMENIPPAEGGVRVVIHRSIDNGSTWSMVDSLIMDGTYRSMADPVVSMDSEGNVYLLVMQQLQIGNFTVHLTLFISEDDGQTWSIKSQPYLGSGFADTPNLLIDDLSRFFISYTEYRFPPFSGSIHFIQSDDGGLTWSNPLIFESLQSKNVVGSCLNFSMGDQINLVYSDYSSPFTYFTSSIDNGNSWDQIIEFPNTKEFSINKIISNRNSESISVFTHEAHNPISELFYNYSIDNGQSWDSYKLADNASMAEGIVDDNGIVHVTFNQFNGIEFSVNYTYSIDGGESFSNPLTLFSGTSSINIQFADVQQIAGESQSMVLGNDNMIHLTFVDWSDFSTAKHLIFEPFNFMSSSQSSALMDENSISLFPNPTSDYLTISLTNKSTLSTWSIYTMEGKRLYSGRFDSNKEVSIHISDMPLGTYLLRMESDRRIVVKKFTKI